MAKNETNKITSTIARSEDGTIQITFSIPKSVISDAEDSALSELAKNTEVPGFRKGMAPKGKVKERVTQNTLIEKILQVILPKALSDAVVANKLKPAIFPKIEVLEAKEGEDWQVRGTTCELPEVDLGNYKDAISNLKDTKIWTPSNKAEKREPTKEEKEQRILNTLLEVIKVRIPSILVEEEVNHRLANLLSRIEKLGLSLEGYLTSIGKNPDSLRGDYAREATSSLALDLILNKIAEEEKISVPEKDIEDAIAVASADPKMIDELKSPERRRVIEGILKRRGVLDRLTALV